MGKTVRVRVRKEVTIKKEITYPHYMPLRSYLAWRLGKEGVKKLMKEVGVRTEERLEELLEEWYTAEMMRQPGVCKNPTWVQFQKFDVETLGEKEVKTLIRSSESGLMIKSRYYPGKTEHYVVLLAMSPVQEVPRNATEEKESQSETEIIPRTEVSNC